MSLHTGAPPVQVQTRRSVALPSRWHRFVTPAETPDLESLFDERALSEQGRLLGTASAGRGNAFFFDWNEYKLVLRHYRRGGMAQRLSPDRYVFLSLEKTRACREFAVLLRLQQLNLPVPMPFACQVTRHGLFYTASIITVCLPGKTLAERLSLAPLNDQAWKTLGRCIATFHQAQLWHADLNAHNIMLDDDDRVYLIDFDRARFRALPLAPISRGWCLDNLQRLKRSLFKLAAQGRIQAEGLPETDAIVEGFKVLQSSWSSAFE